MQSTTSRALPTVALMLLGIAFAPQRIHASSSGLNNIPTADTAPNRAGVRNGERIIVESPRGAITGAALIWKGIQEDTIFVPNTFGPMQKMAEEFGAPLYEPANTLVSDRYFDNLSGQQAYKCFACRIRKA